MKTAEEKAREFAAGYRMTRAAREALVRVLKEQGRDTRHACALAVANLPADYHAPTGTDLISPDAAHAACMNVKAV